jgi:hypothetical protein
MKVTDHRRVCMHIVVIKDTGNRNILLFGPYMTFFIEQPTKFPVLSYNVTFVYCTVF